MCTCMRHLVDHGGRSVPTTARMLASRPPTHQCTHRRPISNLRLDICILDQRLIHTGVVALNDLSPLWPHRRNLWLTTCSEYEYVPSCDVPCQLCRLSSLLSTMRAEGRAGLDARAWQRARRRGIEPEGVGGAASPRSRAAPQSGGPTAASASKACRGPPRSLG